MLISQYNYRVEQLSLRKSENSLNKHLPCHWHCFRARTTLKIQLINTNGALNYQRMQNEWHNFNGFDKVKKRHIWLKSSLKLNGLGKTLMNTKMRWILLLNIFSWILLRTLVHSFQNRSKVFAKIHDSAIMPLERMHSICQSNNLRVSRGERMRRQWCEKTNKMPGKPQH